jgi:uncharacterized membrane protein
VAAAAVVSLAVEEISAAAEPEEVGNLMNPDDFITRLHHDQIVQAIHQAERNTTGQIRIFISHGRAPDPLAAGKKHFEKLRMHHHPHRNAILIFVAPKSQTFAILGDEQIHTRIGDPAWQSLATEVATHFKSNHPMQAIITAIQQAGKLLATHFPRPAPTETNRGS